MNNNTQSLDLLKVKQSKYTTIYNTQANILEQKIEVFSLNSVLKKRALLKSLIKIN